MLLTQRFKRFARQSGYRVSSVGQLEIQKVMDYISNQKEHHKAVSFQGEYLRFLNGYKIRYDEKYLW